MTARVRESSPRVKKTLLALLLLVAPALAAQATPDSAPKPKTKTAAPVKKKKAVPPPNADSIAQAREDSIIDAMWPVKGPDPLPGSVLPGHRIVAYYGNLLSKKMGVLGEYEPEEMLKKLDAEVAAWTKELTRRRRFNPRCI